jgi:hypothetical protein
MLREIGLAAPLLIILTAIVVVLVLSQTTTFGPFAGNIGVTEETALTWGQQQAAPADEAAEETDDAAADSAPEAESTAESGS